MIRVRRSAVIDAPIERVWAVLRDFNSHSAWHPAVGPSHIENGESRDQVGCVRNFVLKDGNHIREQLLAFAGRRVPGHDRIRPGLALGLQIRGQAIGGETERVLDDVTDRFVVDEYPARALLFAVIKLAHVVVSRAAREARHAGAVGGEARVADGCRRHRPTPAIVDIHLLERRFRVFAVGDGRDEDVAIVAGQVVVHQRVGVGRAGQPRFGAAVA